VKLQVDNPRGLNLVALILLCVGFALALIAGVIALRTESFINRSEATEGVVTELVPVSAHNSDSSSSSSTTYAPVFAFTTNDGRHLTVRSDSASNPPSFEVGDKVAVLYDPAAPVNARIDTFGQLWLMPIICGGVGLLFMGFAALAAFALRALKRGAAIQSGPGVLQ
jgi:hypothetical protein